MRQPPEPEILDGMKGFAEAQAALGGQVLSVWPTTLTTGWYDTTVRPECGSFCIVQGNAGFDDLIGEILQVEAGGRSVFVYCLTAADVPEQLALYRRAFFALADLSAGALDATVRVIA